MGGYRPKRFTTTVACLAYGRMVEYTLASVFPAPYRFQGFTSQIVSLQASLSNNIASMSTAQVELPAIRRRFSCGSTSTMSKSRACRQLFGAPDREEVNQHLTEELQNIHEEQKRRWNFDFRQGRPVDGSCWERVSEERVPAFYREAPPLRNPRRAARRPSLASARTSESSEQRQSADPSTTTSPSTGTESSRTSMELAGRLQTETATTYAVPSLDSNRVSNNGITISSATGASIVAPRPVQSHIPDFYPVRKRSRSSSESNESSGNAKQRKTGPAPNTVDRPRSAPAAIATSS